MFLFQMKFFFFLQRARGVLVFRSINQSIVQERISPSQSFLYLGSIETALRRSGAQSAAGDDRPPRERRGDAFEMVNGVGAKRRKPAGRRAREREEKVCVVVERKKKKGLHFLCFDLCS